MQNLRFRVLNVTISHRGGAITCLMNVYPGGIYVQRESAMWVHAKKPDKNYKSRGGTCWVRNRELSRRTKGVSKFMRCEDVFTALRQSTQIDARYAVPSPQRKKPEPGTDAAELAERIETGRGVARSALVRSSLDALEQKAVDTIQSQQAAELALKRDERLLAAGSYFDRALEKFNADALGRPNASVAAMLTGAGIGELIKRGVVIEKTDANIVFRSDVLARIIDQDFMVFEDLWQDIKMPEKEDAEGKIRQLMRRVRHGLSEHALPNVQRSGAQSLVQLRELLATYERRMRGVIAAPFRRNAHHALQDLQEAIALCDAEQIATHMEDLKKRIDVLHEGLRWAFALKELHVSLLAPLSIQLRRSQMQCRHTNRGIRAAYRPRLREFIARLPGQYGRFDKALETFEMRLGRCSDTRLKKRVKDDVVALIAEARVLAKANDWLGVKGKLKTVGRIL